MLLVLSQLSRRAVVPDQCHRLIRLATHLDSFKEWELKKNSALPICYLEPTGEPFWRSLRIPRHESAGRCPCRLPSFVRIMQELALVVLEPFTGLVEVKEVSLHDCAPGRFTFCATWSYIAAPWDGSD
jgi:hypothetical protein